MHCVPSFKNEHAMVYTQTLHFESMYSAVYSAVRSFKNVISTRPTADEMSFYTVGLISLLIYHNEEFNCTHCYMAGRGCL